MTKYVYKHYQGNAPQAREALIAEEMASLLKIASPFYIAESDPN